MPNEESELKVARAVSSAVAGFGLGVWGEPIRVDDGTAEAQVDFRFDVSSGWAALEVSSIVDSAFVATVLERGVGRCQGDAKYPMCDYSVRRICENAPDDSANSE